MTLLTAEQVAEITGHSPATLANWRSKRTGPAFVKLGKKVRYPVDALESWILANLQQPEAGALVAEVSPKSHLPRQAKARNTRFGRHHTQQDSQRK